ncbi:MAG TPA: hypothetical protein VN023_09500 [Methylovorus sp.]|nr:hypothetical protein [Methylovorus sp.]
MTRNTKPVQTPGEPIKAEVIEQVADTTNTESVADADTVDAGADADQVTEEVSAPVVTEAASPAPAKKAKAVDYGKLRAHEIDPKKLTQPVLSADGWVIPASA